MYAVKNNTKTLIHSVLAGALLIVGFNQLAAADQISPGVVTTENGMPADHYGLAADYMWNCGGADQCSPTQGPNRAIFRQSFDVKKNIGYPQYFYGTGAANPADPFGNFALSVIADDYFAVYLNNHLIGWSWLNDGGSANGANFSDTPLNWTIADLVPLFVDGTNVLDIFACNGRSSDNLGQGYAPGATTAGGFSGCPAPSSYGNNWLLVQGGFVQQDNTPGGQVNASARFVSGNGSGENAYLTEFVVIPEPASFVLALTGLLMGFGVSRKKRNLTLDAV